MLLCAVNFAQFLGRDREHQLKLFCKSGNVIKLWIIGNKLRIIHINGKSLFQLISHRLCLGFSFCQICCCTCVPVVLREPNGPNRVDRMTKTVTSHIILFLSQCIENFNNSWRPLYGCYLIITQHSWVFIVSTFRGEERGDWNNTCSFANSDCHCTSRSLMCHNDKDL